MTVSLRGGRLRRPGSRPRSPARPGPEAAPSVREVCLVGGPRAWAEGDLVRWSGRVYRVASARPHGPPAEAEAEGVGYAHLATVPGA